MREGCNFIRFWFSPFLKTVQNSLETVRSSCSSVFRYVLASFPAQRVTNFIFVSAFFMWESTVSIRVQPPPSSLWISGVSLHPQSNPSWGPECTACFDLPFSPLWFFDLVHFTSDTMWEFCIDESMHSLDFIKFIYVWFHLQHWYMLSGWGPGCYWKFPLKTMTQQNYYGDLHMRCWLGDLYNTTITTLT